MKLLSVTDKYLIFQDDNGQRFTVENTFVSSLKNHAKPGLEEDSSWISPKLAQKMMWPLAIIVVAIYQLFSKAPEPAKKDVKKVMNREETKEELNERLTQLTKELTDKKPQRL